MALPVVLVIGLCSFLLQEYIFENQNSVSDITSEKSVDTSAEIRTLSPIKFQIETQSASITSNSIQLDSETTSASNESDSND